MFWKKTYSKRGLEPSEQLHCPICGDVLYYHDSVLSVNQSYTVKKKTYVLDLRWKCFNCKYIQSFGVPVPKDYWKEVKELRGGTHWNPYQDEKALEREIQRMKGKKGKQEIKRKLSHIRKKVKHRE